MNGVHDMGGMHGFGPVATDDDGPFHHDWEVTFHALQRVLGSHGLYTGDEHRALRERMAPAEYLRAGYYEQRLLPIEWLLIEAGVLEEGAVDARIAATDADGDGVETGTSGAGELDADESETRRSGQERTDADLVDQVRASIARNSSFECGSQDPAFEPGDEIVVRNIHPDGHTRCPRYVRRAQGVIEDYHGTQRYPDESVDGEPVGAPLYSVRFTAREVWGNDREETDTLVLQLWEPYLRPAD